MRDLLAVGASLPQCLEIQQVFWRFIDVEKVSAFNLSHFWRFVPKHLHEKFVDF